MSRLSGSRLRPYDYLAIVLAVTVTTLSALSVYGGAFGGGKDARVIVEGDGRTWVYPLDAEETIRVHGPIGETVVQIHDGEARVIESPCENQICVAAGEIHTPSQWVACLPNAVFVRIEGKAHAEAPDASTW
jgi:hypothetical protein